MNEALGDQQNLVEYESGTYGALLLGGIGPGRKWCSRTHSS